MRQNALITLLAHTGSYVPADSAKIGPIDRIFTRIGAADDLAGGRSTFMVEMTEMANILRNASDQSLVLVDEIGRGTSTYDGLSLAWACALDLANNLNAFSLFATHYFEITELADQLDTVSNQHLEAVEHGQDIVFMYDVNPGPANQSYGIQVAKLAGLPDPVLETAKRKLAELEDQQREYARTPQNRQHTLDFSQPTTTSDSVLEKRMKSIEPDTLSAREALNLVYELSELVKIEHLSPKNH